MIECHGAAIEAGLVRSFANHDQLIAGMAMRGVLGRCVNGHLIKSEEVGLQGDAKRFFRVAARLGNDSVVGIIPGYGKVDVVYFLLIA